MESSRKEKDRLWTASRTKRERERDGRESERGRGRERERERARKGRAGAGATERETTKDRESEEMAFENYHSLPRLVLLQAMCCLSQHNKSLANKVLKNFPACATRCPLGQAPGHPAEAWCQICLTDVLLLAIHKKSTGIQEVIGYAFEALVAFANL